MQSIYIFRAAARVASHAPREARFGRTMTAIPRYRSHVGPVILSTGFRPFFLGSSIWAAVAIPLWLGAYVEGLALPTKLAPVIWHAHEMVFGYAAATVAGFLLTAIPNWTGRMPLQGAPLATLVLLWMIGRFGVLLSAEIGAPAAAVADLCFPAVRRVGRKVVLRRQRVQRRGRMAEWLCLWHLRLSGWHILARDWRCPAGEIDILARRGRVLAVIEVKSRSEIATAAAALAPRQRRRINRAAEAFLLQRSDLAGLDLRFDLMLVAPLRLPRHWRGAWPADD